ncbi:FAD-binding oxidoreductase [Caldinitratiruptor microaerophilus]|uniref:FAD-binding protein n=1 Tax=Caldinitratiruptor microaerophilus TaxID=671077 RepID=A0AA35GA54_9FIRM|nr:FAD-linked oxidase C-terminal domain-containing protein [Caldinitratiruptor microaerophilus]BDG60949.1 FAD-binding protein [Caldinitratiruptor microaerophilus]
MHARVIQALQSIVGPQYVLTEPQDLVCYSFDATWHTGRPDVVVLPAETRQVQEIVRLAAAERIPVTPRGAGTGLAGGAVPVRGGILLSLTRMRRIVDIDTRNLLAVVEPGVVTAELQRQVAREGLFYPPDPASAKVSTIGGNIATGAGGPRCFKYGVTRDYVLGLEVVLASGEVLRTGGKTVKNVTGYDLTRLLVGSEGTLGVITGATLRLIPQPETQRTLLGVFPRLADASAAVGDIVAKGIVPTTLELVDQTALRVVEDYLQAGLPVEAEAVLIIEVDGFAEAVDRQARRVAELCEAHGASAVRVAADAAQAAELWQARRAINPSLTRIRPIKVGEDVTVPPGEIPAFIRRFQYLRERYRDLPMVVYGHAGDGNLHPNVVMDPRRPEERARVEAWLADLARVALDLGGTLTGEHGIGLLKAPFLEWEVGPVGMEVMRAVKRALDPLNILNPGKMALDGPQATEAAPAAEPGPAPTGGGTRG